MPLNSHQAPPSPLKVLNGDHSVEALFDDFLRPVFVGSGGPTTVTPSSSSIGLGRKPELIYFIEQGRFKVQRALRDGKCHVIGFARPGDLFGNPFSSNQHDRALVALGEGQLLSMRRGLFIEAVANNPLLQSILLLATTSEIRIHADQGAPLERSTAEERVSFFLLEEYYCRTRRGGSARIPIAMSRRDIADYVGLTIETVSRMLSQLKRKELIDLPNSRTVQILDVDALARLSGPGFVPGKTPRLYF